MKPAPVALLLALAACSGGDWTKAGADAATVSDEYRECQDLAVTTVRTDLDIDQDIRATRGADLQRAEVVRIGQQQTREQTRSRSDSIVASCMKAKGFTQGPK